jgi:hypothetical protein
VRKGGSGGFAPGSLEKEKEGLVEWIRFEAKLEK